jgi:hypothetical protein
MNDTDLKKQIQDLINQYLKSEDFRSYLREIISDEFTAENITATENLTTKNLSLTGTLEIGTDIIDHGPFSQLIQQHSQMIVDQSLEPIINQIKKLTGNDLL